jgi:hypothetical protein
MKIRPEGTESFHADRQTDGQTDNTKVIIAFCSFMNAPRKLGVTDGVSPWTKGIAERDDAVCLCVPVCNCCHSDSFWKCPSDANFDLQYWANRHQVRMLKQDVSNNNLTKKNTFVLILAGDIPLCLSIILKRNKTYTSSNTTILYLINFNNDVI